MMIPDVSFVILNYNTSGDLRNCLTSIGREIRDVSYEIIVVDNGSEDGSPEMVRREFPHVQLEASPYDVFGTAAWNKGIRRAQGRHVAIVNPDVTFVPGTFERMHSYLETHPDVAAVAPRLQNSDGSVEACFWRPRSFALFLFTCTFLHSLFPRYTARLKTEQAMLEASRSEVREVETMIDACMLARREAMVQVGLYDEQFKLYFCDDDICLRLRQAGWKLAFLGDVANRHERHQSVKKQMQERIVAIMREDAVKYCQKHFGAASAAVLRPLVGATALMREVRLWLSGEAT